MLELKLVLDEEVKRYLTNQMEAIFGKYFENFSPATKSPKDEKEVWLSLEEAKKILAIRSRKKWKQLRDDAQIDFAKVGRGFVYSSKSIQNYIDNISSKRKKKIHGK
jgi:hypothetical protein